MTQARVKSEKIVPIQHQGTVQCGREQAPHSYGDFKPSVDEEHNEEKY